MSLARILDRVPSARFTVTATLAEHELRFHKKSKDGSGICDDFQTGNPDHQVIGVVYEIGVSEKIILDKKEGLGCGYNEKEVVLITNAGDEVSASTYYATSIVQS